MAGERRQPALARAANAMMRGLGGTSVKLRLPVAATGGTQRELGIAAPVYQEAQLAPVIVRALGEVDGRQQIEVLIASSTLDAVLAGFGATDGSSFVRQVEQVVYAEQVFCVTDASDDRFAGVAYMHHLTAVAGGQ
jgi:hypothetical protein